MKKSFTMRCMLIALFTVMSIAANAGVIEYSTDDGFKYNLYTETKTAELAKFSGYQKEVVIPENVTYKNVTYSVTSLGLDCFYQCSITSIVIPSSAKSLGYYCFSYCTSLESITVDKNNKVYDSRDNCNAIIQTSTNKMIQGCKTTVIPSSVTSLGEKCFYYCYSLTSITIPSSVTSLGDNCFYKCSSLASIDIPSSVTSLGDNCFSRCSSLTSIDIPSSVTSLGDDCFSSCPSLESITVDKNNKVYDSRENCNAIIETSTNTMIQGCKTTVIPSSVTSLGDRCFFGCSSLTSVTIPSSVKSLGNYCVLP